MGTSIQKILIMCVLVLAAGEAYLIYAVSAKPSQVAPAPAQTQATPGAAIPTNTLIPKSGIVAAVGASSLTIVAPNGTTTLAAGSDTTIVRRGALKDSQTYAQEMDVFRQQSQTYAQDPSKYQTQLQRLIAPSPYVEATISLSDIKKGDAVEAFAYSDQGALRAVKITVVNTAQ